MCKGMGKVHSRNCKESRESEGWGAGTVCEKFFSSAKKSPVYLHHNREPVTG